MKGHSLEKHSSILQLILHCRNSENIVSFMSLTMNNFLWSILEPGFQDAESSSGGTEEGAKINFLHTISAWP